LRQALIDLDLYALAERVNAERGHVAVRASPRQVQNLVELLEQRAEERRRR
jgi:hypothetical protein